MEVNFANILKICMEYLEINEENISEIFDVSLKTVKEWVEGKDEPRDFLKEYVYEELLWRLKEKYGSKKY